MAPSDQNLGCLLSLLRLLGISGNLPVQRDLPYRQRDDFLSAAELAFYRVLTQAVDGHAVVCPKVRVADLIFVFGNDGRTAAQNRINSKHVDFVLCRPSDMRPVLGIELDDRSHNRPDRAERDDFLDQVFTTAGFRLLHVPARRGYELPELKAIIETHLLPSGVPPMCAPPVYAPAPIPRCPKCGTEMVVRTASRGANAGQKFYGCVNYPRCREIVDIRS